MKEGFILFRLEETTFALSVGVVRQVEMVDKITPVPTSPSYVLGVSSLRGQVVPVLDLRLRLGLPVRPPDRDSRLLVVEWNSRTIALLVDSATEFRELDSSLIEQAPDEATGELIDRLFHLEERTVLMLDLQKVLE